MKIARIIIRIDSPFEQMKVEIIENSNKEIKFMIKSGVEQMESENKLCLHACMIFYPTSFHSMAVKCPWIPNFS